MNEPRTIWNPVMITLWVISILFGLGAGLTVLVEPFGLIKAIIGGLVGGITIALFVSVARVIG